MFRVDLSPCTPRGMVIPLGGVVVLGELLEDELEDALAAVVGVALPPPPLPPPPPDVLGVRRKRAGSLRPTVAETSLLMRLHRARARVLASICSRLFCTLRSWASMAAYSAARRSTAMTSDSTTSSKVKPARAPTGVGEVP